MSIMIAEVYKALVEAGASEDSARAAAGSIPVAKDLATRQEVAAVKQEVAAVKQEVAAVKEDIAAVKQETAEQETAELRIALRYNTMFLMLILGLLVKLVFFPG